MTIWMNPEVILYNIHIYFQFYSADLILVSD